MTDDEIIKSLKCCSYDDTDGCRRKLKCLRTSKTLKVRNGLKNSQKGN